MVAKIGNNGKDFALIPIRRIIDGEELRDRPRKERRDNALSRNKRGYLSTLAKKGSLRVGK